jgi:hypothetical protein
MRKVTIQYQPFRWPKKYLRYHIGNFPSTWDETTPTQLIAIACLLKQTISDVQFISAMTGLSKRIINRLDDYQRFQLIELFDTFHSNRPYNEFIIDKLDCGNTILLAPEPKLKGVTFGQFIFLDTYFANYQESANQTDLNKFIAAAFLPFGQQFAEYIVDANHEWVGKTDILTREAIVINYHLIRDWLSDVYPMVFLKQTEKEKEKKEPGNNANKKLSSNSNAWIKVFDGLVGDDIINEDNYANLPLHNVLRFLTSKIKENNKTK